MAAPSPPNRRPRLPRRSSTPKCSRAAASTKTLFAGDILREHRHRLPLARTGRLLHDHLKAGEIRRDLGFGNEVGPGRQNGRLQDRVAGRVEPYEIEAEATVRNPGLLVLRA